MCWVKIVTIFRVFKYCEVGDGEQGFNWIIFDDVQKRPQNLWNAKYRDEKFLILPFMPHHDVTFKEDGNQTADKNATYNLNTLTKWPLMN